MQLVVPERSVADTGSFPVDPDGVASWLARLDPGESDADARELLRGLVHSNRLHNDVDRRRAVVTCFLPRIRALHERLADVARAQPLPLVREFMRAGKLAVSLLREESIAFRLLLADSPVPRADDARRAMQALARLVELAAHAYREPATDVLGDAHALWRYARAHGIEGSADTDTSASADAPASLGDHYRFILALSLVDPAQYRARQLPALLEWLRVESRRIVLDDDDRLDPRCPAPCRHAIDLAIGTVPAPTGSVLLAPGADVAVVDTGPMRAEATRQAAGMHAREPDLLGADTLERQTLSRLANALAPPAGRRASRRRTAKPVEVVFGHKCVSARLHYDPPAATPSTAAADDAAPAEGADFPSAAWQVIDRSSGGMRLESDGCRAGMVQVGELVVVDESGAPDEDASPGDAPPEDRAAGAPSAGAGDGTRVDVLIGVVRRVRASGESRLSIGVELLARSVLPVSISRETEAGAAPERALIIACKVRGRTLQTMLVPAYLYRSGDRLLATLGGRSRRVTLARRLQMNGLFSHYEIVTTA